jgi:hypothetical protein
VLCFLCTPIKLLCNCWGVGVLQTNRTDWKHLAPFGYSNLWNLVGYSISSVVEFLPPELIAWEPTNSQGVRTYDKQPPWPMLSEKIVSAILLQKWWTQLPPIPGTASHGPLTKHRQWLIAHPPMFLTSYPFLLLQPKNKLVDTSFGDGPADDQVARLIFMLDAWMTFLKEIKSNKVGRKCDLNSYGHLVPHAPPRLLLTQQWNAS